MEPSFTAQSHTDPEGAYALLSDEQLIQLAREKLSPARDELLTRTARLRTHLIRRLSLATRLDGADRQDVMQEAFLWTLEAIRTYQEHHKAAAAGCCFRSYLHRVISYRFIDFLRHRHRYYRHLVPVEVYRLAESDDPLNRQRHVGTHAAICSQPEQELEGAELHDQLQRQLGRLDPNSQRLWSLLVIGLSIADIARELHISYDVAKHQRRKLIQRLRRSLQIEPSPRSRR